MDKTSFKESLEIISEKIKKRDADRQQELERKREEREQSAANNEKLDFFITTFDEKREEIELALRAATANSIEKSELPYHFDKIIKNIQSLQNFISVSAYFLRVYDVRKSQETVQDLQQRCQELEDWLLPKKKFSFKVRKPTSKTKEAFRCKLEEHVQSSANCENLLTSSIPITENLCGFTQRIHENLTLKHEVIYKKDVTLSHIENCTIHLTGVSSTLHITDVQNSLVLSGPVATSIFIENCIDCTFVLACQQMRIHNTRHCDFYIHVTSKAIIEDTKEVRFAPYTWKYDELDRHFQLAGLEINRNNWDFIDDFNWLACDRPSPHWRVLKENELIRDWV